MKTEKGIELKLKINQLIGAFEIKKKLDEMNNREFSDIQIQMLNLLHIANENLTKEKNNFKIAEELFFKVEKLSKKI